MHFFLIDTKEGVCLSKRKSGIWNGLYEFPFLEFSNNIDKMEIIKSNKWLSFFGKEDVLIQSVSKKFVHHLSHQKIHAKFWELKMDCFTFRNLKWNKIII